MNRPSDQLVERPAASLQLETVSCSLCRCEAFRLIMTGQDHLYHVPGEFRVVRCSRCGHAYMNPQPIFADILKCYPDEYGPYQAPDDPTEQTPARSEAAIAKEPWYLKKWVRAVPGLRALYYWLTGDYSTYMPDVPSQRKRALEVGCSKGDFLQKLRANGWEAAGVELGEAPAEIARRRGFPVHTGTLESAGFENESFEAVFLYMVLEHVKDPKTTLEEIHRLLVPGGWLVFSVPNFACWERVVFRDYWLGLELPRHLQHFTPRRLKSLLQKLDFREVQIIHQRNLSYIVGAIGSWSRETFPRRRIGQRLIDFTDNPSLVGTLLLSPFAKLAALVRQGGRLTVIARKPDSPTAAWQD